MAEVQESQIILEKDDVAVPPRMYAVILHNDDYTTMDFVVYILTSVFQHSPAAAEELMMQVHNHGRAVCGRYPYDIAVSKISIVRRLAQAEQYPLLCSLDDD